MASWSGYVCRLYNDAKAYFHADGAEQRQAAIDQVKDDLLGNETVELPSDREQNTNNPAPSKQVPLGLIENLAGR